MKMTLLQLVQSILSDMSSDEVNSFSDTTESMQVAEIVRQTYFNIISRADLPNQRQIYQLTSSTDASLPVLMYRPDNVSSMDWIKYSDIVDSTPTFQYVEILPVERFLDMVNQFNSLETDVVDYTFNDGNNSFNLLYKNDKAPQYCCALKNYYVLFDSYDSSVDSTLQSSKTMCYGETIPVFSMSDNFTPELDAYQFPLLLSEAKALAFLELKQMMHAKAEQENKRQWSSVQIDKSLVNKPTYFNQLPNFGRRSGGWQTL